MLKYIAIILLILGCIVTSTWDAEVAIDTYTSEITIK